jgi:hypothetical protein
LAEQIATLLHPSITHQSPINHPSITHQSPINHPSITHQSPINHPSTAHRRNSLRLTVNMAGPRMRRFSKYRRQRKDKYGIHSRASQFQVSISDGWVRKQLKKLAHCADRLSQTGVLRSGEIQKLKRDISILYGNHSSESPKTKRRQLIYRAFLESCIKEFGPYMALLISCTLTSAAVADVGNNKRDAFFASLRTKNFKREPLVTLASKYGVPDSLPKDWKFEYAPSTATFESILDKMKEKKPIRLGCSIPVEDAEERPLLTFEIDRDLFWKVIDIANTDTLVTSPLLPQSLDTIQSMSLLEA